MSETSVQLLLLADGVLLIALTVVCFLLYRVIGRNRQAEWRAAAAEGKLDDVLETTSDWYWEMDADLRMSYLSPGLQRTIGVSPDRLIGRRRWDIAGPGPIATDWAAHRKDLEERRSFRNFRYSARMGNGRTVHITSSGKPFFDETGEFRGYRGISSDITSLVEVRESAQRANRLFAAAIENMREGFALFDQDRRLVACNDRFVRLHRIPAMLAVPGTPAEELRAASGAANVLLLDQDKAVEAQVDGDRWIEGRAQTLSDGLILHLTLDISDRKRSETGLVEAMQQAEVANEAKSQFLANMSHELRTPLNAIIGYAELIHMRSESWDSSGDLGDFAKSVVESGRLLLSIVNDILDLSKIEAGRADLDLAPMDSRYAIETAVRIVRGWTQAAGREIRYHLPEALPVLMADERAIKQVVINLLSNAVKFSTEGDKVEVVAAVDGDGLRLEIRDNGVGMTPAEMREALEPFAQVGASAKSQGTGTGLGLPIAQALVELQGGRLELDSAPGRGTTVTVFFPETMYVTEPGPLESAVSARSDAVH